MKTKIIYLLAVLLIPFSVCAAPFGDGFATGNLSSYFENASKLKPQSAAFVQVKGMAGKKCLRLTSGGRVELKRVPVEDSTKYTLTFNARFDGGEGIEDNPRFATFCKPNCHTGVVPLYGLEFYDSNATRLHKQFLNGIPFRDWHQYTYTFYPPKNAVSMRMIIRSGKPKLSCYIDDIRLVKTVDQGAININPVISDSAVTDYSGWMSLASGGKRIVLDNGKTGFYSAYGSGGTSFPLSQSGTYCLSAKKKVTGYFSVVILRTYNDKGKELQRFSIGGNGGKRHFILPKGTKRGSLLVYSSLVDEIRLNRVGDENKILEIKKKK